jgi:hypothetical protein
MIGWRLIERGEVELELIEGKIRQSLFSRA